MLLQVWRAEMVWTAICSATCVLTLVIWLGCLVLELQVDLCTCNLWLLVLEQARAQFSVFKL